MVDRQTASKGRVVRLYMRDQSGEIAEECAAIVAEVFAGDYERINACGFRTNGNASAFTSIAREGHPGQPEQVTWDFPKF